MLVVLFLTLWSSASSKTLPPDIQKCSLSDPELGECLAKSTTLASQKFKQGNKELGIIPLDPLVINKVELGNSTGSSVNINQVYENMKLYEVIASKISNSEAKFHNDSCYWNFTTSAARIRMEADYKITGRVLLFPINGHGKCNNTLYDVESHYKIKCQKYLKKGKQHIRMTDLDVKFNPKKAVFDFENLVDGNEQLSREIVKTLNENALEVYGEIGYVFDQVIGRIFKDIVNQVFSRVPEEKLFLP